MAWLSQHLGDWQARQRALRHAQTATRWVLIDTETSGLDPRRDRLIALAGVAVDIAAGRPSLRVADSFEAVLQCPAEQTLDEVARRNILLHGVGRGAQDQGLSLEQGLRQFLVWVDAAPCIAFHAGFDAEVLERACRQSLGQCWPGPWLDLAVLARALYPELELQELDDWLQHFGLVNAQRHRASSDAWASAELLQMLWSRWTAEPLPPWRQAQRHIAARRWTGSGGGA